MLSGIALGTIVTIALYHLARAIAPAHLRDGGGTTLAVGQPGVHVEETRRPPRARDTRSQGPPRKGGRGRRR